MSYTPGANGVEWRWDPESSEYYYLFMQDNRLIRTYQSGRGVFVDDNDSRAYPTRDQYYLDSDPAGNLVGSSRWPYGGNSPPDQVNRAEHQDTAKLDLRFRVRNTEWFAVGRVIKVLWAEPAAAGAGARAGDALVSTRFGEHVHVAIRWFVVLKPGQHSSICLRISTYHGRGTTNPYARASEHSVIYTGRHQPDLLPGEQAGAEMLEPGIKINPTRTGDTLANSSRLCYSEIYTVQHNVKVFDFGCVESRSIGVMLRSFYKTIFNSWAEFSDAIEEEESERNSWRRSKELLPETTLQTERARTQDDAPTRSALPAPNTSPEVQSVENLTSIPLWEVAAEVPESAVDRSAILDLHPPEQESPIADDADYPASQPEQQNSYDQSTNPSTALSTRSDRVEDPRQSTPPPRAQHTQSESTAKSNRQPPVESVAGLNVPVLTAPVAPEGSDAGSLVHPSLNVVGDSTARHIADQVNEGIESYYSAHTERPIRSDSDTYQMRIISNWDLKGFLSSQYDSVPPLGSILALTGTAKLAQATTCALYIRQQWPELEYLILDELQSWCEDDFDTGSVRAGHQSSPGYECNEFYIDDDLSSSSHICFTAEGSRAFLLHVTQQIGWLSSALRLSKFDDMIASTTAAVRWHRSDAELCVILEYHTTPLRDQDQVCWTGLFDRASLATGFPVPERGSETGLEIPLDILSAIGGVVRTVEHRGGVLMKGFSNMFIPIRRAGEVVQWHYVSDTLATTHGDEGDHMRPSKRRSYDDGIARCPTRLLTPALNIDEVHKTRAIVGWCSQHTSYLGSGDPKYHDVAYSGLEHARRGSSVKEVIIGNTQYFTAQMTFVLGSKEKKLFLRQHNTFCRVLTQASSMPLILWDVAPHARRGWMVSIIDVFVHILQGRFARKQYRNPSDVMRRMADDQAAGMSSWDILEKYGDREIWSFVGKPQTVSDEVLECWSKIEFLLDQSLDHKPSSFDQPQHVVHGFDYREVVEPTLRFVPRHIRLDKTCGGWPDLARAADILILFGDGFEDLLEPKNELRCSKWQRLPRGKDYLASLMIRLLPLYEQNRVGPDGRRLGADGPEWHRGKTQLFEACVAPNAAACCERLQSLVLKPKGHVQGPGCLTGAENGIVIFGQHKSKLLRMMDPAAGH